MNPYSEYKDSNIQWLGKIPTHWLIKSSKHIFSFISRGSAPTYTNEENSTMVVNQAIFSQGKWDISKIRYTTECFDNSRGALFPGDILIASTGGGVLGKVFYFTKAEEQYIADSHVTILRSNHKTINAKFYSYIFSISYNYINAVLALGSTNQTELQRDMLRCHKLPVPFFLEQQAIVDYLDRETVEMDALITEQEELVALLKQKRSAIIMEAVCRGLDPTVPMKDSGVNWPRMIPSHWNIIKAKYIATIKNGQDPRTEGDIPVYGSGASSFKTCGEYKNGPTVLIGRKGATLHIPHYITGKYWNVDTAFDVHVNEKLFNLRYYYYLATCFDYKFYISQTTLPSMTQTNYENMSLPYFSINEQQAIVDYLDRETAEIDYLIADCKTSIQLLKQRRTALISEAVTGKIDVRTA